MSAGHWFVALGFLACVSGGCNPSDDNNTDVADACSGDGELDCLGTNPGNDAAIAEEAGDKRLSVSTLGIILTDKPLEPEMAISGTVMIDVDGEPAADGKLEVNGLPWPGTGGSFELDTGPTPGFGPGETIELVATATVDGAEQTTSLTIQCPSAVDVTSPAENSLIASGQTLSVEWSGTLTDKGNPLYAAPIVGFYACLVNPTGNEATMLGHGDWFVELAPGQSSATVPVTSDCARYLMEIRAAGPMAFSGHNLGYCFIQRRVWLKGPG